MSCKFLNHKKYIPEIFNILLSEIVEYRYVLFYYNVSFDKHFCIMFNFGSMQITKSLKIYYHTIHMHRRSTVRSIKMTHTKKEEIYII